MTNCLRYARMFNRLLNCWKFSLRFTNGVRRNKARYCPRLGDYKTKQQTVTRQNSSIELNKHLPIEGWCPNTMPHSQKRSELSVVLLALGFYYLFWIILRGWICGWSGLWESEVVLDKEIPQENLVSLDILECGGQKNSYKVFFFKVKTIHMCYYACCIKDRTTELRPYII